MKKKVNLILALTVLVFAFSSCGTTNAMMATYSESTDMNSISLERIDEIVLSGDDDYKIVLDKSGSDPVIYGFFKANHIDKKLVINSTLSNDSVILFIRTNKLPRIIAEGSGDVSISDEFGLDIDLTSNGSGDIELKGKTEKAAIYSNGSGDILAGNFKVKRLSLISKGSGDSDVFSSVQANVILDGTGDVTVKGSPNEIFRMGSRAAEIQ